MGYITALFGLQHITYEEETLGFGKIFPERSADNVINNLKGYLNNTFSEKPFYIEINFFEPHRPFDFGGVKPFKSKGVFIPSYIPTNTQSKKEFASMQGAIQKVDNSILKIINILKNKNHYQNTLILFTTDHGIPFPRAKGTLYDAGIETSLIMHYPKLNFKKKSFNQLISNIDILPTLLDFAKIKIPKTIQGKSFYPLILNKDYKENKEIFAEKTYQEGFDPIRCVRDNEYKLIINFDSDKSIRVPADTMKGGTYQTMIDKLVNARDHFELYNIKLDKFENNNLAYDEKFKTIKDKLTKKIKQWMILTKDPLYTHDVRSPFFLDTLKKLKSLN